MGDLDNGWTAADAFPDHPLPAADLTARLDAARAETMPWDDPDSTRLGFAMSAPDPFATEVWASFLPANTNNVGVHTGFGAGTAGTRRLEREALLGLAGLYHADSADGYLTSGATEAVIQALRIGRNTLRDSPRDHVTVITGEFAHHSVAKAAEVLGLGFVAVPSRDTWTLTADDLDRAIDRAAQDGVTRVLVVATAGYYNSGLCDPIPELTARLRARAVRDAGSFRYFCHVDAAHGGFVFPFSDPGLAFDFRNPGVHTMAVDPHKSGLLPYACGVLLARKGLFGHATSVSPVTGVVDDTLTGSRPGAAAAALWSVLFGYGRSRFTEATRACLAKRDELAEAIRAADPHCHLRPAPSAPVVAAAFRIPGGRLPRDFTDRYRLVPVNAPAPDGGRRLYYHFYAGHSLTPRQTANFREHLARAVAAAASARAPRPAATDGPGQAGGPGEAGAAASARGLLPPTACFRHFVTHPPGRRDPDGPHYSFHTFLPRRSTGEPLRAHPWGTAPSGREVTVFATDPARPFSHDFLGVATGAYTAEFLDRHQQKLSLVGAVHFSVPLPDTGCQVLVNLDSDGAFRSIEYKFGADGTTDEVQCFADRTIVKIGKCATGVRRPHSDDYSFSVDTSLECEISWQDDDRPPHLTSRRLHADVLLPRHRHQPREQYRRFPNRFFDTEIALRAGRGHPGGRWALSELPMGRPRERAVTLARSALLGLCTVDLGAGPDELTVACASLPAGRDLSITLPRDLGLHLSALLPRMDVSAPEELSLDAAVGYAEAVYPVIAGFLPTHSGPHQWHVEAPAPPTANRPRR